MFSGLMSMCTTPCLCSSLRPSRIWVTQKSATSGFMELRFSPARSVMSAALRIKLGPS